MERALPGHPGRNVLLREIWERLDSDVAAGVRFAKNDPNVVAVRQLLLHKVVQILR